MFRCSAGSPCLFNTERFLKNGGIVTTTVGKYLAEAPYRDTDRVTTAGYTAIP